MNNLFKKTCLLVCLLVGLILPTQAANVTVLWNQNPETNIVSYTIYQSNHVSGAVVLSTVNHPTTTTTFSNITAGVNYSFWATAKNDAALESDPSVSVSYFLPASVPPSIVLNRPIFGDFSGGNWRDVEFSWPASPSSAATTNYVVRIQNVAVPSNFQTYNTSTPNFTFATIPLDDWTITVVAQNRVGSSAVTASSTYNLSKRKPNSVVNLRVQ
jgi:hypothetical protein